MIKEVLQSIDGNVYYTLVGLVIFLVAFAGVLLWTWTLDKGVVEEMSMIPFNSDNTVNGTVCDAVTVTDSANSSMQNENHTDADSNPSEGKS